MALVLTYLGVPYYIANAGTSLFLQRRKILNDCTVCKMSKRGSKKIYLDIFICSPLSPLTTPTGLYSVVDSLTSQLRHVIEKYTDNVRFCIICNYLGKIIPALQSRCTRFRFAPLQQSQIVPRLQDIVAKENVKITEDGIKALLTLSGGDMRKVLNTLQSTWLAYREVTEDNVYTCVGHPLRSDIDNILNWLLNENDFAACFKHIQDLKILKGLALGDILTEIHTKIQRVKFPPEVLVSLLIKMADSEARLASGCSERIELAALIASFQLAREQIDISSLSTS